MARAMAVMAVLAVPEVDTVVVMKVKLMEVGVMAEAEMAVVGGVVVMMGDMMA